MKQKHILKYSISICFCIFLGFFGQVKAQETTQRDSLVTVLQDSIIPIKKNYGLRVGVDLAKPILSYIKGNYTGFELLGDYRIKKDFYIAAEIGTAEQSKRTFTYAYTGKGEYIQAGINWNTFKNWLEMDNEIYLGARYGFSLFDTTREGYTIYQKGTEIDGISGPYFDRKTNLTPETYKDQTAHWFGLQAGLKVETFKNLYLGAYAQFNFMITQTSPENFKNFFVPGFNKVYSSGAGLSFGYSIAYRIPLYKK